MARTLDSYFRDWESHVFGRGYGSGEEHTIGAVRKFLTLCDGGPYGTSYDYQRMESEMGPEVAWLLINTLSRAEITEYGTSTRYAWLTTTGVRLKEFMIKRSLDDLVKIACGGPDDDFGCWPCGCNCGPNGYEKGRVCQNPFWLASAPMINDNKELTT